MNRLIQTQHLLKGFPVNVAGHVLHAANHGIDHIAWDEADGKEDQDGQQYPGWDEQQ